MTARRHLSRQAPRPTGRGQRGAALLLAMIVLTLVATLAAGMVYQQDRAIRVETAERAREQTSRVALGGLELARWILRQDATKNAKTDHLGEAWATALPETELSTLISGNDRSPAGQSGQLRAFMRGQIIDAQSRFNLRNLVNEKNELDPAQLLIFRTLAADAGLPDEVPVRIANALREAWATQNLAAEAYVAPTRMSQLTWLGVEPAVIETLRTSVDLLPERTAININTALAPVLSAAITGLDRGGAERVIEERRRGANNDGLTSPDKLREMFPQLKEGALNNLSVTSAYFEVRAELRIGDEITRDVWLLRRRSAEVSIVREERLARYTPTGS